MCRGAKPKRARQRRPSPLAGIPIGRRRRRQPEAAPAAAARSLAARRGREAAPPPSAAIARRRAARHADPPAARAACRRRTLARRAGGAALARTVRRRCRRRRSARRSPSRFAASLSDRALLARCSAQARSGEAPLAATLPDGRVIAGTVDRLLIEERRVSVLDFKTGRVPARATRTSRLRIGRRWKPMPRRLRVIFPGREISAALLYTAGPQLFELRLESAAAELPIWLLTFDSPGEFAAMATKTVTDQSFRHRRSRCSEVRCSSISGRNGAARAG